MKQFLCTATEPIVKTTAGLLRGYRWGDVYHFNGVKYADSRRFEMPTPVKPWEGLREAQNYGYCCKVLEPYPVDQNMIVPHRYWHESENCQYLNIWTKSISPDAKKPVMVWIHGGGYANGSSLEHVDYDGENLADYADVVVVSINHRLNIIGYLDLSAFDDKKYHNSANVGNADIVAALEWIRDNIAQFGGDPNNVTIFGQSGGGSKVSDMLQTPAAAGLFHKAIIESGIADMMMQAPMDGHAVASAILRHLGLTDADYEVLTQISYEELAAAFLAVRDSLAAQGVNLFWGPKPNDYYAGNMMQYGICEHAKTIPVLIGSVFGEFMPRFENQPEKRTEQEQLAMLQAMYGEHTDEIARAYRAAYPDKPLCYATVVDNIFRSPTLRYLESWVRQSDAPIYNWTLTYFFDYMGVYPTWHCAEIPLVMHNIDKIEVFGSEECERLQSQMCNAWVSFARTGDPNHAGLPHWRAYDAEFGATMVFDRESAVKNHYDRELMHLLDQYRPPISIGELLHQDDDSLAAHPY